MPLLCANCSCVRFACSRSLRMNRPSTLLASISPIVEKLIAMHRTEQIDCFEWLRNCPDHSLHAVCTDPPYGILEFTERELTTLRAGRGGVWRLPPKVAGSHRDPLP